MATAHEARELIAQTTTGTHRRRVPPGGPKPGPPLRRAPSRAGSDVAGDLPRDGLGIVPNRA